MSRRSGPPDLPPRIQVKDGRHAIGANPTRDCRWCGIWFDPAEYPSCPRCAAELEEREQEHREGLRLWADARLSRWTPPDNAFN